MNNFVVSFEIFLVSPSVSARFCRHVPFGWECDVTVLVSGFFYPRIFELSRYIKGNGLVFHFKWFCHYGPSRVLPGSRLSVPVGSLGSQVRSELVYCKSFQVLNRKISKLLLLIFIFEKYACFNFGVLAFWDKQLICINLFINRKELKPFLYKTENVNVQTLNYRSGDN